MIVIIILIAIVVIAVMANRPVRNSHYLPQQVEFNSLKLKKEGSSETGLEGKMKLSREDSYMDTGCHLKMTIQVDSERDLSDINNITLRWRSTDYDVPMYDFKFYSDSSKQYSQVFSVQGNKISFD